MNSTKSNGSRGTDSGMIRNVTELFIGHRYASRGDDVIFDDS